MQVAAQGQTLSNALSFWADVSYGDVPPTALIDYPPLGFEAAPASRYATAADGGRQLGRKTQPASDEDGSTQPVLLLGVKAESTTPAFDHEGLEEAGLEWCQPQQLLLWPGEGLKDRRFAAAATTDPLAPVPHLRYEDIGLLAVVYVYSSGIAYVGYPQASDPASSPESTDSPLQRPENALPADTVSVAPPPSLPPSQQLPSVPICLLPMSSSTGFVRSLLGLS
ncbi:hypothetical protein Q4I28_000113 [Leishmania naiffi]|uniref:Uncharacterized protein n=1 Tax=Leishmania naiffi TaxID=5678 RepID=A0AAW3CA85_9TRYP